MTKNSPEILELRRAIEASITRRMQTPADFNFLAGVVWERIRQNISPTTLKRLWGYIDGADTTRVSTLNILSKFLSFSDWDDFLKHLEDKSESESHFIQGNSLKTEDLSVGSKIEIQWQPNRYCLIEFLGNNTFKVVESKNSKLKKNDIFSCAYFLIGEPLYIDNLRRGDDPPVAFVAGNKSGLTFVKKIIA